MTQGGFEVGADYVAARVSFDIDNSGVSSLRELSEELSRFRTATEAANRTGADFMKYLQQMTQLTNQATEAQTNLVNQIQKMADFQQSMMNTSPGIQASRGVPQGQGQFLGMGGGNGAGTASSRPATLGDASTYLGNLAQQDPRRYFNMQNNWGNVRTGDVPAGSPSDNDLAQHAQRHYNREKQQRDQAVSSQMDDPLSPIQRRISGMTSGAASLLSELSPGGNGMGLASMAAQGLGSLSGWARQSGAATSALGPGQASAPNSVADAGMLASLGRGAMSFLGTGAGVAAAGVGAAASAGMLYQMGGEVVQGYRSMGQTRGGGFQEGLGYEMAIRSMAMNPFITTDQARQIVSAGLSSGYTGKEFDTLTQFIAANLKDMNMSVADSMKMFKKNVTEGGVSAEGVSGALETLKVGSRQGYSSLETMTAGYANTSSAFINAGMSGSQASRAAAASTFVFNDSAELAGLYSSIASSAAGDKKIGGLLMNPSISGQNMPMGTTPESAWERISGDPNQAVYNILRYFAQLAWQGSGGDEGIAVSSFHSMLKQNFPQVDWQSRTKVRALLKEVLSNPNAVKNANSQEKQAGKEAAAAKPLGTMQRLGSNISGNLQTGVAAVTDLFKNVFTRSPEEGWNWDETIRSSEQWQMGVNEVRSPMLSTLVNQTQGGSKNLQVGDGKSWQQLDLANVEQIKALSDGKMKIRERGDTSGGKYLTEIPNSGKNGINGVIQTTPVYGKLEVTVHQNGKVDAPQTVQLSPAQQGAMEGVGGFYPNTAPPGDPRRGAYG